MPIYELNAERIRKIPETSFGEAGLRERQDLQRLLRDQIDVISPDTLVISEEFGEWEESRRRIDLLGVDKDANLVVVELKRTEDGGHMELQAIRYAAMVSTMTFEKAVEVYANYLKRDGRDADAEAALLEFLEWDEPDEDRFAQEVRVVLASSDFSRELTTAVMWLNERDLDIRCIRIKPYCDDGRVLIDVQQVVPLPEAADYMVRIREKVGRERSARRGQSQLARLLMRFWAGLLQRARTKTGLHASISPSSATYVGATSGTPGMSLVYAFGRKVPRVELYIDTGDRDQNKALFDELLRRKDDIEKRFGDALGWERIDDKRACRIRSELASGTVRDEAAWPDLQDEMIDRMIRFEKALRPALDSLAS